MRWRWRWLASRRKTRQKAPFLLGRARVAALTTIARPRRHTLGCVRRARRLAVTAHVQRLSFRARNPQPASFAISTHFTERLALGRPLGIQNATVLAAACFLRVSKTILFVYHRQEVASICTRRCCRRECVNVCNDLVEVSTGRFVGELSIRRGGRTECRITHLQCKVTAAIPRTETGLNGRWPSFW